MKVLLINPWANEVFPPPSLGYIQAALKHWKVDVRCKNLTDALIDSEEYDLVGVTFHSFSVKYARQIRDKFKTKLICGGHHPSALPDQMLSIGYDQVIVGEGENTIIDIIQGNEGKIIQPQEHKYFFGINELPIPDYTGLLFGGELGIPIISSRGCPYECSFCASTNFWGHKYKMRSADNVLWEIDKRKSEGYRTWMFEDDNFTANKKRVYEICSQLDGKYKWQCASRAESLDEELCKELYRAGCRTVWLGIESLSQKSLDRCNKNTTPERMLEGVKNAEDAGIETMSQFIIGLPGDTIEDIKITNKRRLTSSIHRYGCNIAWVLPGTKIHEEAKLRGFDDSQYLESGAPFYTYENRIETLQYWANLI